jgi:hypothetical protein
MKFDGKNHGFRCRFSQQNQSIDIKDSPYVSRSFDHSTGLGRRTFCYGHPSTYVDSRGKKSNVALWHWETHFFHSLHEKIIYEWWMFNSHAQLITRE